MLGASHAVQYQQGAASGASKTGDAHHDPRSYGPSSPPLYPSLPPREVRQHVHIAMVKCCGARSLTLHLSLPSLSLSLYLSISLSLYLSISLSLPLSLSLFLIIVLQLFGSNIPSKCQGGSVVWHDAVYGLAASCYINQGHMSGDLERRSCCADFPPAPTNQASLRLHKTTGVKRVTQLRTSAGYGRRAEREREREGA